MVAPAEEVDRPVVPVADEVAGLVDARSRLGVEGVRNEALRRQLRAIQIAAGEAVAADVELAGQPDGNGLHPVVEDVKGRVRDRPADRQRLARLHAADRRPDRRLGRAVHVPELEVAVDELLREHGRKGLAAAERLQARDAGPAGVDEHPPRRRRRLHDGRAGALDQLGQPAWVGCRRLRGDHDARPGRERQVQLEPGDVEGERRHRDEDVACIHSRLVGHGRQEVDEGPVRDLDTLRLAGGARRVDHVCERLRGRCARRRRRTRVGDPSCVAVEADRARAGEVEFRKQALLRDDGLHRSVLEHETPPVGREGWVDRDVGAAGTHDPEEADEHVERPFDADRHEHVGADAELLQEMGQPVREGVELGCT